MLASPLKLHLCTHCKRGKMRAETFNRLKKGSKKVGRDYKKLKC